MSEYTDHVARLEADYEDSMVRVAAARTRFDTLGATERSEVRIARVLALRLQAEHAKEAAAIARVDAAVRVLDALFTLGADDVDFRSATAQLRNMAATVGLRLGEGHRDG